jgi:hypothetical protein
MSSTLAQTSGEHLRSEIAILRAETAYQDAKFARKLAEVAVKEYDEGSFDAG